MRIGPFVFMVGVLLASPSIASDTGARDAATQHLSYILNGELGGALEKRLVESGLAPADVDLVVDHVIRGYAECFVETLTAADTELGRRFLALLAEGRSLQEVGDELKAEEHEEALVHDRLETTFTRCTLVVDQEAGLPAG